MYGAMLKKMRFGYQPRFCTLAATGPAVLRMGKHIADAEDEASEATVSAKSYKLDELNEIENLGPSRHPAAKHLFGFVLKFRGSGGQQMLWVGGDDVRTQWVGAILARSPASVTFPLALAKAKSAGIKRLQRLIALSAECAAASTAADAVAEPVAPTAGSTAAAATSTPAFDAMERRDSAPSKSPTSSSSSAIQQLQPASRPAFPSEGFELAATANAGEETMKIPLPGARAGSRASELAAITIRSAAASSLAVVPRPPLDSPPPLTALPPLDIESGSALASGTGIGQSVPADSDADATVSPDSGLQDLVGSVLAASEGGWNPVGAVAARGSLQTHGQAHLHTDDQSRRRADQLRSAHKVVIKGLHGRNSVASRISGLGGDDDGAQDLRQALIIDTDWLDDAASGGDDVSGANGACCCCAVA